MGQRGELEAHRWSGDHEAGTEGTLSITDAAINPLGLRNCRGRREDRGISGARLLFRILCGLRVLGGETSQHRSSWWFHYAETLGWFPQLARGWARGLSGGAGEFCLKISPASPSPLQLLHAFLVRFCCRFLLCHLRRSGRAGEYRRRLRCDREIG